MKSYTPGDREIHFEPKDLPHVRAAKWQLVLTAVQPMEDGLYHGRINPVDLYNLINSSEPWDSTYEPEIPTTGVKFVQDNTLPLGEAVIYGLATI